MEAASALRDGRRSTVDGLWPAAPRERTLQGPARWRGPPQDTLSGHSPQRRHVRSPEAGPFP